MTFTDSDSVEQMILDAGTKPSSKLASMVCEDAPSYEGESLSDVLRPARWAIRANVAGLKGPVTR
jgi:hypothetical protein